MSIFKVKLTSNSEGLLDTAAQSAGTSVQRTMYAMGPNKINRKLNDGQTFTDSNYWKRFATPNISADQAFIQVLVDDGSPYTDVVSENTYAQVWTVTLPAATTFTSTTATVVTGSTTNTNVVPLIDILGTAGNYATFVQISTATQGVNCRLNGSANAVFAIAGNSTQIFNPGDVTVSRLEFSNTASGASTATVTVVAGIQVLSNS